MSEASLIASSTSKLESLCSDRNLLVIQDTTEINLQSHSGRLKPCNGLGPVGNNTDVGFFLHPSLVLDQDSLTPLGFSSIDIYHRDWDKGDKHSRGYTNLPITEKESYKWIRNSQVSKQTLSDSNSITIIQDREGDIYEQFCHIPDSRTHLLIRVRGNRRLANVPNKLYEYLEQQEVSGTYKLEVDSAQRTGRLARNALMQIKFKEVEIKRPETACKNVPKSLKLYVVEAKESSSTVPKGEKAICWRILTTHTVETLTQAKLMVTWYSHRWFIEQIFRLMKKKGFAIENSELETGWALRKLTVLVLQAVLKVCQLMIAYGKEDGQPISEVFEQQEIACLEKLNQKLEGSTQKIKNPYPRDQLSWATWVIARLAGWSGYKSQRRPGAITLKNGLARFNSIFDGWSLSLEDVYTR